MSLKVHRLLALLVLLMLLSTACNPGLPVAQTEATQPPEAPTPLPATEPGPDAPAPTAPPAAPEAPDTLPASDPQAMVEAFYRAYLQAAGQAGSLTRLVADPAYADSPYLTRRLVGEIQGLEKFYEIAPENWIFDLFLGAQQAPADAVIEILEQENETALAQVRETFSDGRVQFMSVLLARTADGWRMDDVQAGDLTTPEGVAQVFFNEYAQSGLIDPLLSDGGFEPQEYMSAAYRQQVDEIIAGFEMSGFDPVLHAQDYPRSLIQVASVQIDGDTAQVVLSFDGESWKRTATLERVEDRWLVVPDAVEGGAKDPAETVEAFYAHYLDYIRGGSIGEFNNPLSSGVYRDFPYLSFEMLHQVDQMAEEGFFYDPFLCAQDVPEQLEVTSWAYNQGRPVVTVSSSFPNHFLVVDLIREDFNRWAIRRIVCGGTAEATARAFYTWYLGYIGQGEALRSPLVDGAYRQSNLLSSSFIAELDTKLSASDGLGFDPILLAQDIPQAFNTAPGSDENSAWVDMQFGDATVHRVRVEMVREDSALKIAAIQPVPQLESPQPASLPPGVDFWAPLVDEQYGYALRYPGEWQVRRLRVNSLQTPQDHPNVRALYFQPPSAAFRNIWPCSLTVVVNPEGPDLLHYPAVQFVQEVQAGGGSGQMLRSTSGQTYYVFQHPNRPEVWLVLEDLVSAFPGREAMAAEVSGVMDTMLETLVFEQ